MIRSSGSVKRILRVVLTLLMCLTVLFAAAPPRAQASPATNQDLAGLGIGGKYIVLAWNDLGMHCYGPSFKNIGILPLYNTLWAQVVRVGDPPQIVTSGVIVEYYFPKNSYSAGKSDFWKYAQQLFGLSQPLPKNIGLNGNGLAGQFALSGDHFTAIGIPLTEYTDKNAGTGIRQPYQKAMVVVRDAANPSVILAQNEVVAPVSSEMSCQNCHADGADATTRYPITPTGSVDKNILAIHDYLSQSQYPAGHTTPLLQRTPVLCDECHSSNAIGAAGLPGVNNLSNAMHNRHKNLPDITPDTNGCYNCHPGPTTKCLRDAMSTRMNFTCETCHGTIANVASNPNPWLNEPKCDNPSCHGAGYTLNNALYRQSQGHGSLYCAGCHDSPHAIAPSREPADAIKFINLQGHAGTLRECSVCHKTQPAAGFSHAVGMGTPPNVDTTNFDYDIVSPRQNLDVSAHFTDAGSGETHTAQWRWGDGMTSVGTVNETTMTAAGSHAYNSPGVYTVRLILSDSTSLKGQSFAKYIVVQGRASSIAGTGEIDSAAGFYKPAPFLFGKASFGLFARYRTGAANMSPDTAFNITLGSVNFSGTVYQSLARQGIKSVLQGKGQINGSGDYTFLVSAIDGNVPGAGGVDRLRVRIWETATGKAVYDNLGPPPAITSGEIASN
jgi:PKD repeat protein